MVNKIVLSGLMVALIAIAVVMYIFSSGINNASTDNQTTSTVTDIKTSQEAASLQKDTASIVNEIDDTLSNIEDSLPDV